MKNILTTIILCCLAQWAFSQNMGIDEANPSQKLDVGGWIEIGNQSQGSSANAGVIRYNTGGYLQYHNGSSWVNVVQSKTTFTVWGRDDCPSTSSLVYWGYAGGGHAGHSGSGFNTLCLTSSPSWSGASYNDGNQNGALIYGAEFQTSGYGISTLANRHDYDSRCAVCVVNDASDTNIMMGRTTCPSGWTQQYWGYIMGHHYTQWPGEYLCIHNNPELHGSTANHDGTLWYPSETELGSLTSPYVQNRELRCAVCTQ